MHWFQSRLARHSADVAARNDQAARYSKDDRLWAHLEKHKELGFQLSEIVTSYRDVEAERYNFEPWRILAFNKEFDIKAEIDHDRTETLGLRLGGQKGSLAQPPSFPLRRRNSTLSVQLF